MDNKYEVLFAPMKIGGATIKNRVVLCAMEGTNIIEAGQTYQFNEHCRESYLEWAKGGIGLMIPGMIAVRNYFGGKWLYEEEELFMGPVKELLDEIHSYGSKVFLQIGAGMGRVMTIVPMLQQIHNDPVMKENMKMIGFDTDLIYKAPTAGMPNVWVPDVKTTEMSKDEIRNMVDGFAKTARLCQKAGFDGIEIHAVHEGYMLDQFAMECTNKRTDEYGGSLENRFRFITEIIKSVKRACGNDYPVSVRFSVESKMRGFNQGALPGEEYKEFGRSKAESLEAAKLLEKAGADLLDADNGSYDSWFWAHPPVYMPLACNLENVSLIKAVVSIPVVCAGRMENPDTAAEALKSGKIDGVGIARQFLCDPEWLTKIENDAIDDIRPCIACHNACFAVSRFKGNPASLPEDAMGRCALNPATLRESEYKITPALVKKKVAVIGGGIAGMEVARICKMRGHDVTLYEKSNELGGVFIAAAAPNFKEKDKMLLEWYRHQVAKLEVNVRLNTVIKPEDIISLDVDEIIVATGAKARKLAITGANRANVMEAIDYLLGNKPVGENVVIIGGGLTGCEIAYDLALKGKKPVIVEMMDDILKIMGLSAANSNMLREIIRYYNIPVHLESKLTEINDSGVVIETAGGKQQIPADSVILSVGYTAGTELAKTDSENVHILGDAAKVGNLKNAIWQAYELALKI
jgi:2-enoate reductase